MREKKKNRTERYGAFDATVKICEISSPRFHTQRKLKGTVGSNTNLSISSSLSHSLSLYIGMDQRVLLANLVWRQRRWTFWALCYGRSRKSGSELQFWPFGSKSRERSRAKRMCVQRASDRATWSLTVVWGLNHRRLICEGVEHPRARNLDLSGQWSGF